MLKNAKSPPSSIITRKISAKSIIEFQTELGNTNWQQIKTGEVNSSYEIFHDMFI